MPLLDLELARRITEGIVGLLARWAPEAQPYPEDRPALEFAQKLRRRDPREILYLPELAIEPAWPPLPLVEDDSNHERVLIRVETGLARVEYACAVFTGSLVHWERAIAVADGSVEWVEMAPDRHWSMKLETPETLLREMGLTLIPPAAMSLAFGRWSLRALLDPREHNLAAAGREVARLSESILHAKGVHSPAKAYERVIHVLRLGYDLGSLADTLQGREPSSLVELHTWLADRPPPFAWTREAE